MKNFLTIITPTYNRAYILSNAYNSLCRQTNTCFEWIVVDDGSTDNSESLVRWWQQSNKLFEIRYYKQQNSGKHIAINKGVQEANCGYVLILDSDDYLTDDAVEEIERWICMIDKNEEFAGVAGLKGRINKNGCVGGSGNGKPYIDAKYNEKNKYKLSGDKAEVYKTEVLKKHPFPKFNGENFCPENVVWYAVAEDGYKLRWFNKIIYKCEYLNDGLTKKSNGFELMLKNFNAFTLSSAKVIKCERFLLSYYTVGLYYKVAKIKGLSVKEIKRNINVNAFELFVGRTIYFLNYLKNKITKKRDV